MVAVLASLDALLDVHHPGLLSCLLSSGMGVGTCCAAALSLVCTQERRQGRRPMGAAAQRPAQHSSAQHSTAAQAGWLAGWLESPSKPARCAVERERGAAEHVQAWDQGWRPPGSGRSERPPAVRAGSGAPACPPSPCSAQPCTQQPKLQVSCLHGLPRSSPAEGVHDQVPEQGDTGAVMSPCWWRCVLLHCMRG